LQGQAHSCDDSSPQPLICLPQARACPQRSAPFRQGLLSPPSLDAMQTQDPRPHGRVPAPKGLPAPDVTLWMALPPGAAAARGGFGGERYEDPAFQE
jgi:hypothetical protein